jgi:uncharacterized protein (TIGR01244 family)
MNPIYNFHQVNTQLACAGQPTEEQLQIIASEGYSTIINLALTGTKYSLPDEAASVKALGMTYHHIPVQFDNPQLNELEDFLALMDQHKGEKLLVHCAANYRASVFTGLYLLAANEFSHDEMTALIENIWQPDAVWQQFVDESVDFLGSRPN